jgi:hypothetical protein
MRLRGRENDAAPAPTRFLWLYCVYAAQYCSGSGILIYMPLVFLKHSIALVEVFVEKLLEKIDRYIRYILKWYDIFKTHLQNKESSAFLC